MKIKPVQFNFTEKAYDQLTALKVDLGAASKTEVVRHALTVLWWLVQELKKGHTIWVQRAPGEMIELAFPYLNLSEPAEAKATDSPKVGVGAA